MSALVHVRLLRLPCTVMGARTGKLCIIFFVLVVHTTSMPVRSSRYFTNSLQFVHPLPTFLKGQPRNRGGAGPNVKALERAEVHVPDGNGAGL